MPISTWRRQFTVRSAGVPDRHILDRIAAVRSMIERWEVIVPPESFPATLAALREAPDGLPIALPPVVPIGDSESTVHHFVTSGFDPLRDTSLDLLLEMQGIEIITALVFRANAGNPIESVVSAAADRGYAAGMAAVVNVELPYAGENMVFDDDALVADRVAEAVLAARKGMDVEVFLDGFVDHDRSYYPRHGLIDRRFNPRPALHALVVASSSE